MILAAGATAPGGSSVIAPDAQPNLFLKHALIFSGALMSWLSLAARLCSHLFFCCYVFRSGI